MNEVLASLILGWASNYTSRITTQTQFVTIDFLVREPILKLLAGKLNFKDLGSSGKQQVTKKGEFIFLANQSVTLITKSGIVTEKPTQIWKEFGPSETHLLFSYSLKKNENALAIWNWTAPRSLALKTGTVNRNTEIELRDISYNLNKEKLKPEYQDYKNDFKDAYAVLQFHLKGKIAYIVSADAEVKSVSEKSRKKREDAPRLRWAGIFDENLKAIGTIVDFAFDSKEQLDSLTPLAFLDLDGDGTDEMVSQRNYYEGSFTHIGKMALLENGRWEYNSREIAGDGS